MILVLSAPFHLSYRPVAKLPKKCARQCIAHVSQCIAHAPVGQIAPQGYFRTPEYTGCLERVFYARSLKGAALESELLGSMFSLVCDVGGLYRHCLT